MIFLARIGELWRISQIDSSLLISFPIELTILLLAKFSSEGSSKWINIDWGRIITYHPEWPSSHTSNPPWNTPVRKLEDRVQSGLSLWTEREVNAGGEGSADLTRNLPHGEIHMDDKRPSDTIYKTLIRWIEWIPLTIFSTICFFTIPFLLPFLLLLINRWLNNPSGWQVTIEFPTMKLWGEVSQLQRVIIILDGIKDELTVADLDRLTFP